MSTVIRKRYSSDFKAQALELVSLGKTVPQVAQELGIGTSWQNFLHSPQCKHLRTLWNQLDASKPIEPQLDAITEKGLELTDWRGIVIKCPQVIDYCGEREMRFGESHIYLLKKQQMNGSHAELYSYALDLEIRASSRINPLLQREYVSAIGTDYEPHLRFTFNCEKAEIELVIFSWNNGFAVEVHNLAHESPLAKKLRELAFSPDGDHLKAQCERGGIRDLLGHIQLCV